MELSPIRLRDDADEVGTIDCPACLGEGSIQEEPASEVGLKITMAILIDDKIPTGERDG